MKNYLTTVLMSALSLFFVQCSHSQPKPVANKKAGSTAQFERLFVQDFSTYKMDIAAAGIASLPSASLSATGELVVNYQYTSGGENRTGRMLLQEKKQHHFEGHWKTNADNGNQYAGTLYFDFKEDGTASGFYQFGGSTYKITIEKK